LQTPLQHGNIYQRTWLSDTVAYFFRKRRSTATSDRSRSRLVDLADLQLKEYSRSRKSDEPWQWGECVLVCVPHSDQAQQLVLRGAYLAERLKARFVVLSVARPGLGLDPSRSRGDQPAQRALQLARELEAKVITREATRVGDAIVSCAREFEATQIVLGESKRSWLRELIHGSITQDVLRQTSDVDVHIVQKS
jgi:two-component system sensor histidine kinase KdpD